MTQIHDHYHCWNQKQPPACGQKIPHLKCCLCEAFNPAASAPKCEHGMLLINCSAYHSDQPQQDWEKLEKLSAELHDIYQKEAHRQEAEGIGPVRHYDEYEKLSEPVKEFDRVLARHIQRTIAAEQKKLLQELLAEIERWNSTQLNDESKYLKIKESLKAHLQAMQSSK